MQCTATISNKNPDESRHGPRPALASGIKPGKPGVKNRVSRREGTFHMRLYSGCQIPSYQKLPEIKLHT